MNNLVAKNCNKFNKSAIHTDRKKSWSPDIDEELESYFEDLVTNADEVAIKEYADRKDKAGIC